MVQTAVRPISVALFANGGAFAGLRDALTEIEAEHGPMVRVVPVLSSAIQEETIDVEEAYRTLCDADVVLYDLRGGPDRSNALLKRVARTGRDNLIPVYTASPDIIGLLKMGPFALAPLLGGPPTGAGRPAGGPPAARSGIVDASGPTRPGAVAGAPQGAMPSAPGLVDSRRLRDLGSLDDKIASFLPPPAARQVKLWVRIVKYWFNGGKANLKNLFLTLAREYGGLRVSPRPPIVYPANGVYDYDSDTRLRSVRDLLKTQPIDPDRPTIGLLLYGGNNFEACVAGVRPLFNALRYRANVIPVYSDGIEAVDAIAKHFVQRGRTIVDAIVSMIWFRLSGGPLGGDPAKTIDLLTAMDVPVFVPVTMHGRRVSEWADSPTGVSPNEALNTVTFPELDGGIESIPLWGLAEPGDPDHESAMPILDRVDRIADRVFNRARLRMLPNDQKKVAIVIYNYPPGEANLAGGSYLDTLRSVEGIVNRLADEGYTTERIQRGSLKDRFLKQGMVNSAQWIGPERTAASATRVPATTYRRWFAETPAALRDSMIEAWGEPIGDVMTSGTDLLIPALRFGNVLVGLQPSRGIHENPEKVTHDRFLPPHHQYLAFYKYVGETFAANMVLHIGTHGTVEFMPGKEIGLSAECAPDVLIGPVPHSYFYHVVNPSEAMIAKRRSLAQLINYASPSYGRSGLYEEYQVLDDMLIEHSHLLSVNEDRAAEVRETLLAKAKDLGIDGDDPGTLADLLGELKRSIIPVGLHVLGDQVEGDGLVTYLTLVARYDRGDVPAVHRLICEGRGLDWETAREDLELEPAIEDAARAAVAAVLSGDVSILGNDERAAAVAAQIRRIAASISASDELGTLVRALNGGYVLPNIAGDPIRTPETYPTGSNSYQFDPRLVPTIQAAERGSEIAEQTLAAFLAEKGRYPASIGLVLWGFETAKTYGETVAQIFSYLGLRVSRGFGWYPTIQVIPIEELGRPRVDVNVTICGFFRDLFPNLLKTIDQGFKMIAALDEPDDLNPIKKHARAIRDVLISEGKSDREADRLSTARLFGPNAGEYGNRLNELIETSNWQSEDEFAKLFIRRQAFVYGENIRAIKSEAMLTTALSTTEVVTQVRDSHAYEIGDLDHYFEFLGGLTRATKFSSGAMPTILMADTTKERIRVMPIGDAIRQSTVTRLLNPKWIDGNLAHDHKGGAEISERVDNLLGLSATTNAVDSGTWNRVAERFVFDDAMLQRLIQNNPYAAADITRRIEEASRRGYWDATPEQLDRLREQYLTIEAAIEETT